MDYVHIDPTYSGDLDSLDLRPGPLPPAWRNIGNLPALDAPALAALGWYPVVDASPAPGPFETLGAAHYRLDRGVVTLTRALTRLPEATIVERQCARIDAYLAQRLGAATVDYNTRTFQADPVSQSRIAAKVLGINNHQRLGRPGPYLPEGYTWRDADNVNVPLNDEQLVALAEAMAGVVEALIKAAHTVKDRVRFAADPGSVDITTGWPGEE